MDCKGVLAVIAVLGSSITVGCGGTSSGADSELSRESGALDRGDLSGSCFLIKTAASNGRYLDAYTSGNGDVVTRPPQGNDTQHWCFTARAWVGSAPYYVIAHRSSTGVGDHRIPRPIGEDRGGVIGGLHHSPVKIWAERLEAA
jgi:hypothetical protein